MVGSNGERLYEFLQQLSQYESFKHATDSISESSLNQRGDEELVLRFLTVKNAEPSYKGNIQDWLDTYMENILFQRVSFDYDLEERVFKETFDFIDRFLGSGAFVKYRGAAPVGGLAPAYFEAVTMGVTRNLSEIRAKSRDSLKNAVISTLQSAEFRSFAGPGANSKEKLANRILAVGTALLQA